MPCYCHGTHGGQPGTCTGGCNNSGTSCNGNYDCSSGGGGGGPGKGSKRSRKGRRPPGGGVGARGGRVRNIARGRKMAQGGRANYNTIQSCHCEQMGDYGGFCVGGCGPSCAGYSCTSNSQCNCDLPNGPCFQEGTKINTSDGIKFIENIEVGEIVKSYDEENGKVVDSKVTETFIHNDASNGLVINGIIKTTTNHPFYTESGEWVEAISLNIGDKILHVNGEYHEVKTLENLDYSTTVYNFEVDNTHTYFAEEYLVHNKVGGGRGRPKPAPPPGGGVGARGGKVNRIGNTPTTNELRDAIKGEQEINGDREYCFDACHAPHGCTSGMYYCGSGPTCNCCNSGGPAPGMEWMCLYSCGSCWANYYSCLAGCFGGGAVGGPKQPSGGGMG